MKKSSNTEVDVKALERRRKTRQILSGIKAWYSPEEMVGKKVVVLVNLKPAKLAGVLSEGMILFAEDEEGKFVLVSPEKETKKGSEVR